MIKYSGDHISESLNLFVFGKSPFSRLLFCFVQISKESIVKIKLDKCIRTIFSCDNIGEFLFREIKKDEAMLETKDSVSNKLTRWFTFEKEKLVVYVSGSFKIWSLINECKEDLLNCVLENIKNHISEIQDKNQHNKKAYLSD